MKMVSKAAQRFKSWSPMVRWGMGILSVVLSTLIVTAVVYAAGWVSSVNDARAKVKSHCEQIPNMQKRVETIEKSEATEDIENAKMQKDIEHIKETVDEIKRLVIYRSSRNKDE